MSALTRLSDFLAFNRHKVDHCVMQFSSLRALRIEDREGLFLARRFDGKFNLCGIQVRESLTVPFDTVIFEDDKGTEVGRIEGLK